MTEHHVGRTYRQGLSSALVTWGLTTIVGPALAAAHATAAREVRAEHVTVSLLVASEGFDERGEMWVGVQFQLDPDWHVYWQNPGDSGGPPEVRWRLPEGVVADDITWPAPERFALGPMVNYGYTGDVVLPARLRREKVPAGSDSTERGAVTAAGPRIAGAFVRWVLCRDICIAGEANLEVALPLPAAERAQLATWKKSIEEARRRAPVPAPGAWRSAATSQGDVFVLRIDMDRKAPQATFFPLDAGVIDESAPQGMVAKGRSLEFRLQKSVLIESEPDALRGVVAPKSGASYVVTAPVRRATESTGKKE